MVSLDITSLFTNVPVEDVLNFIDRQIQNNRIQVPVPREMFMSLLRLCVEGTVFEFEGLFFRQRHGIAMGSPLSPVLAGLFMEYFECELLSTLSPAPPLWLRYVDDVLLIWPNEEDFGSFLSNVNALSDSINFTVEWEEDGKIPFLDTLTHRLSSGFSFAVYRKPTHSGTYLHYFSRHSDQVKLSVLSSIYLCMYRLRDPIFNDSEKT